jgi:predicted metal-dependent hydrolase
VKTHPHLLVRDVLAELFVRAAAGAAEALQTADELAAWASGDRLAATERLCELKVEDGGALFEPGGGVAERFAGLDAYVRDRARRYAEALRWIAADAASASVIDRARAAWDAGLFFEVHEVVEPAWLEASGDQRTLLQGIIMAGAALHHLVGGNTAGARGLLRDAARRLSAVPEPADLAVGAFASALDALAERVDAGSIPLDEVLESLPRLERRSGTTAAEN